jgi:DNA-binding Lrp family transcriptional regulator
MTLDDTDRAILRLLHDDARLSLAEVARRSGLALTTVHRRLHRLQEAGVVRGFRLDLNPEAVGLKVTAFARLRLRYKEDMASVYRAITAVPEVEEIHVVVGDYDLLLKLRARDNAHVLGVLKQLYGIIGFVRSSTEICLGSPLERLTEVDAAPR